MCEQVTASQLTEMEGMNGVRIKREIVKQAVFWWLYEYQENSDHISEENRS